MRDYEVVYIFDATLEEDAVGDRLERFHDALSDSGEVTAVDHWGVRQLAYPIDGASTGYYVVTQFRTEPDALPEFERILKLDDELVRYLIVLHEGEPTAPMSASRREGIGFDEDEYEEDDEADEVDEDDDEDEG